MTKLIKMMERLNSVSGIPLALLDGSGLMLDSRPYLGPELLSASAGAVVIEDFRLQKRDALHPLISFIEPGFLLGAAELCAGRFALIGPASPIHPGRTELLRAIGPLIRPEHAERFCDRLLKQPLISLEQMKDMICLLTGLCGLEVPEENILFVDNVSGRKIGTERLERTVFRQREEPETHVPTNFESAICAAVEAGDRAALERTLFQPFPGRIGRMSDDKLRQQKYSFICMAALASRAAIRGGMSEEAAFSLSDLYCQRADALTAIAPVQDLTFTMLTDYCERVREARKPRSYSPVVEKCVNYISVHLHESVGLERLSRVCGLCGRSLSLRFRSETGMGIGEYVHREKCKEARFLLRQSDYSLSEITSFLNYPSQSYFTQVFKKYVGRTPQQYRSRVRKL